MGRDGVRIRISFFWLFSTLLLALEHFPSCHHISAGGALVIASISLAPSKASSVDRASHGPMDSLKSSQSNPTQSAPSLSPLSDLFIYF